MRWLYFLSFLSLYAHEIRAQENKVYGPGKIYIFQAIYFASNGDTLSNETLLLQPTGRIWSENKQEEVFYFYENLKTDSSQFLPTVHGGPLDWETPGQETTGFNENEKRIGFYPFRHNQYYLTELAPFPQCPLSKRIKTFKEKRSLSGEWGSLSGKIKSKSQLSATAQVSVRGRTYPEVYKVSGASKHKQVGKNYLDCYCTPDQGIIKMVYTFFNGQGLLIELTDSGEGKRM